MKRLLLTALLLSPALPAWCQTAATPASPRQVAAARAAADQALAPEQVFYQYLLSEIAHQRGNPELATRGLLDLAEKTRDARVARRAVEVAFRANQPQDALAAALLWAELEPNSTATMQVLGVLAGNQGRLETSAEIVSKWLMDSKKAPLLFTQLPGMWARYANKPAVAEVVRKLAKAYPKIAESHFAIAQTSAAAGEILTALTTVNEALRLKADLTIAAQLKAQLLRETSDEQAAQYLREYLGANPQAVEARVTLARLLVSQKKYSDARQEFQRVQEAKPNDAEITYARGLLALQMQDYADAESQFQRVLEQKPSDPNPVYYNLAAVAEARKDTEAALNWYYQVGRGDYFIPTQLKVALLLTQRDGMEAARRYLQEAQAAEGDETDTKTALILVEAQILRNANAFDEALNLLSQAVDNNPDAADLLYDRAMVAEKLNRLDLFEADLRRVIQLKPDQANAYNALGYTLADRNMRLSEAYELIQTAIGISPDDASILDSLGWVQYRLGKLKEAKATLNAAYKTRQDPEIAAHLGEVLWVLGEQDEARKIWQGALQESPGHDVLTSVIEKYRH